MLINHLLIAWRILLRHRYASTLNLLGLVLGITAAFLIFQYTWYEWSFDRGINRADKIYRLGLSQKDDLGIQADFARTYTGFKDLLDEQIPEIENIGRLDRIFGGDISVFSDKTSKREESIFFADPEIIEVFGLKLIEGSRSGLLSSPGTGVLTQSGAERYFPGKNPIGQELEVVSEFDRKRVKITAIVEDIPQPSHLNIHVLLSYQDLLKDKFVGEMIQQKWAEPTSYTYIRFSDAINQNGLEKKISQVAETIPGWTEKEAFLQPITAIHQHSNLREELREGAGDYNQWWFLNILGVFILLIAWFNYINLSTARSLQRAKEVGVRKVIGASRRQLIFQFMAEAFILNLISFLVALVCLKFTLPYFETFLERSLPGLYLPWIGLMVGVVLIGTILSGSYPAFFLSAYHPVRALSGNLSLLGMSQSMNQQNRLRKLLVTLQFVISICLIAGTLLIREQLNFMQNQDLGFNTDQVLMIQGPEVKSHTAFEKFEDSTHLFSIHRFRQMATSIPGVKGFTAVDGIPGGSLGYSHSTYTYEGKTSVPMPKLMADEGFIDVFEIPLLAGTFFEDRHQNQDERMVITRDFAENLGFENPEDAIGKVIKNERGFDHTIIGVTEGYHHFSLKEAKTPMGMILYRPTETPTFEYHSQYAIKVETKSLKNTVNQLEDAYQEVFPANTFSMFFLDEYFNAQYEEDTRFGFIFAVFAIMAIVIACLGLMGMISFSIYKRAKEMGIRKILGASVSDIFILLSKDLFFLMGVAGIIALPLIWIGIDKWLSQFAFRISPGILLFLFPILMVFAIALLAISFQALRAARQNPVEALRWE
ncbi:MAG: ABC transporter permease [Bacteroidetes bacterium]|nr:ABC transporter permease [Bacteroidota bacterium]